MKNSEIMRNSKKRANKKLKKEKAILERILCRDFNKVLENSRIKNEDEKIKLVNDVVNFLVNKKFREFSNIVKIVLVGKAKSGKSTLNSKIRNFIDEKSEVLDINLNASIFSLDYSMLGETMPLIEILEVCEYDKNINLNDNIIINL